MNKNNWLLIGWSALMLAAGAALGYWNWAPHQVVESSAPTVVQAATSGSPNGSVVAERKANPIARPKQTVPKGTKVERIIGADITPEAQQQAADQAAKPCPKVHIDATVVRDADGAGRVVISSPDGTTSNATDTVVNSVSVVVQHQWAAGASIGTGKTYGGWVDRDFGRIRTGIEVFQAQGGGVAARAHIGFSFGS